MKFELDKTNIKFIFDCPNSEGFKFNKEKDLSLAQFDCKTDVDGLHTVATFAKLLSDPKF